MIVYQGKLGCTSFLKQWLIEDGFELGKRCLREFDLPWSDDAKDDNDVHRTEKNWRQHVELPESTTLFGTSTSGTRSGLPGQTNKQSQRNLRPKSWVALLLWHTLSKKIALRLCIDLLPFDNQNIFYILNIDIKINKNDLGYQMYVTGACL